jgi:NADPH2:quinone reductase
VAVKACSLNRGELKRAETEEEGTQIGWDFSSTVEKAAADGSGPPKGPREVGLSRRREGLAELVSVSSNEVTEMPDNVSFTDAAALPVPRTALYSLERCERLLGSNVLITGASGGVGIFACQLATLMSANVYGQIRRPEHDSLVASTGATPVLSADGNGVSEHGLFRGIIDGVGGGVLATVLKSLSEDGRAVLYRFTDSQSTELGIPNLIFTGAGRIDGFYIFRESQFESCAKGLSRLSRCWPAQLPSQRDRRLVKDRHGCERSLRTQIPWQSGIDDLVSRA